MKKILFAITLAVLLTEGGIHMHRYNPHEGEIKLQSWDQENLKRNDHGCPTAIYVAPSGELKQCNP
jgi:hypothetical protein